MNQKIILLIAVIVLGTAVFIGCGMSDENNPLGVIGGGSSGYGSSSGNNVTDLRLLGTWYRTTGNSNEYYSMTFYSDYSFEQCYYWYTSVDCQDSYYSVDGNILTIGVSTTYRFEIIGNALYLYSVSTGSLRYVYTKAIIVEG